MAPLPYHVCDRDVVLVPVWDGRRGGPGSAYLFVAPETPQAPRARRRVRAYSLTARVLDALAQGPRTGRSIAAELRRSSASVCGALYGLMRRGEVIICGEAPVDPRQHFGRRSEHVYARVGGQS